MMNPIYFKDRNAFRKWLTKNHEKESSVKLLRYKNHTNKSSPTHMEAMHEAICFGWIDTTIKRVCEDTYTITFVKRKENAKWSNNTLSYAKDLLAKGKMSPQGLKMYNLAKDKPTIDHNLPKNPPTPKILQLALNKNKKAKAFFETLAPSYRRLYIYMIERAKLPATKAKNVNIVIDKCNKGEKQ